LHWPGSPASGGRYPKREKEQKKKIKRLKNCLPCQYLVVLGTVVSSGCESAMDG
jgi:hypothetical protein